jgi:hypothetical protein
LFCFDQDPNVKLIRELRAENARLRAMLGEPVVSFILCHLLLDFQFLSVAWHAAMVKLTWLNSFQT